MKNSKKITEVLHSILEKRNSEGEFYGYKEANCSPTSKIKNIFISAVVSRLLLESSNIIKYSNYNLSLKIKESTRLTVKFIEDNQSTSGTWNYFVKEINGHKSYLPDDLDDTFNCLLVLNLFNEDKTNSKTLVDTMNVLLKTERKFENLIAYNTWVTEIEDIDPVVQVITHKFLSRIRSVPSQFDAFLNQTLNTLDKICPKSKYYENRFYILMELSSIPAALRYIKNFKKYLKKSPQNTYDLIMFYQIKNNLGLLDEKDVEQIIKIKYKKSAALPFYIEKYHNENKEYCYSDTVGYALYLRLLCSISKLQNESSDELEAEQYIYKKVIKSTIDELSIFSINITDLDEILFENKSPIEHIINETMSWNRYLNNNQLGRPNVGFIAEVVKHTYYGWIGYTTIDSIIDNQIPKSYMVLGNHFAIESSKILERIIHLIGRDDTKLIKKTREYVGSIYKDLHKAHNLENNSHIKMKDVLFILSNKAIGHSIGTLMLYIKFKGYQINDLNLILKYFYNHLTMRQLSDDIHDWKIDLKQKRITLPTFLLRNISKEKREAYINTNIIPRILRSMQASKVSLDWTLKKLNKIISREDQIKIIDQSDKYLRGIKQAIKEIEFYKKIKK